MAEKRRQRAKPPRRSGAKRLVDFWNQRKAKREMDFKPDPSTSTWLKTARMTKQQRLHYAKWLCYILTCIGCLVLQDAILSQLNLFGATTDLAVAAILLIAVLEGSEIGSLFLLISSILYFFSGSAPNAYCIVFLTFWGVAATMFRQMYWHRSKGSVILCAAVALTGYEITLFVYGLMQQLTIPSRIPMFLLTCLYSCIAMIPLYTLIHRIGLIGGNTWKE